MGNMSNPGKLARIIIKAGSGGGGGDYSGMMHSLNLQENIFENYLYGNVSIVDVALTRLVQQKILSAGDTIDISFAGKAPGGGAEKEISVQLRIYKIETSVPLGQTLQGITLHFTSLPFLKNKVQSISRKYEGKVSEIIKKVASELGIDAIIKDSSDQNIKRVFTYSNPMSIIKSLTKMCGKGNDFNFVFYQDIDMKYKLVSIASLMKAPSKWGNDSKSGFIVGAGFDDADESVQKRMCNHTEVSQTSAIDNAHHDMVASYIMTFDVTTKEYVETIYSLKDKFPKQTHLSGQSLMDIDSAEYYTKIINSPINCSFASKSKGLFDCNEKDEGQDLIGGENDWVLPRRSMMEQLNQMHINFTVPGNSVIRAGDVLFFGRPIQQALAEGEKDVQFNGKYLCTSVKHHFTQNKSTEQQYVTVIKAIKDSKGAE